MRLSSIITLAAAALLTACSASTSALPGATSNTVCRPGVRQALSSVPKSAAGVSQTTAARLGLWPREGPSIRVCGDVGKGFARCQAWLRTDIHGEIAPNTPAGYAPSDLQAAYGLASDSENQGVGVTVAIVDAYDDPNASSDLNVYRSREGLPACTTSDGCFTKQTYTSQTNAGWAAEESLDVDMVSAICPHCNILLVEAASDSVADLSAAEQYATARADAVSNSWGSSEGTQTYDGDYSAKCATIAAATGDEGYNSTAQWPAILPSVVAVGGTSLTSISPLKESAWSGAGSGCSKIYGKPSFQSDVNTGCSMRAEADVSADADPRTGVAAYDTFHQSGWLVFGGTSVAAPIVASVFALAGNEGSNSNLYAHASNLNNVTSGSNGGCGKPLCVAGAGWNGPTGLGTPNGIAAF